MNPIIATGPEPSGRMASHACRSEPTMMRGIHGLAPQAASPPERDAMPAPSVQTVDIRQGSPHRAGTSVAPPVILSAKSP